MELSEKIQKLRKEHNLTQEQLAARLYVSRTAVSKWETGRGTPSLESLKLLAEHFHITLDQLLSTEEIVAIAERENKEKVRELAGWMEGVLNLLSLLGMLLPLYKSEENGVFYSLPLYELGGWQGVVFWIAPAIMVLCGIAQMLLVGREKDKAIRLINIVAGVVHIGGIVLLIVSGHPYPAVLFFFLFAMKGILMWKKRQ